MVFDDDYNSWISEEFSFFSLIGSLYPMQKHGIQGTVFTIRCRNQQFRYGRSMATVDIYLAVSVYHERTSLRQQAVHLCVREVVRAVLHGIVLQAEVIVIAVLVSYQTFLSSLAANRIRCPHTLSRCSGGRRSCL